MDSHVLRFPELENHIFIVWSECMCVCVCVSVCMCVCERESVISITQKQITAESSNLVFYICIIKLLESFYRDWTKTLCTGAHKKF